MSQSHPTLSVVVAAYNEEPLITDTLERITAQLQKEAQADWELVCVNDGSTDATGRRMDEFASQNPRVIVLHHRHNFGQGRALRTAFAHCQGQVVVTLDADLSYGPEYISILKKALDEHMADIALASPYMKGGTVVNVPFHRRVLSRYGNWYLGMMSRYRVATSTCVVRAYRKEVLDSLFLTSDGMELQIEILMKSSLLGFKVCEAPARLAWPETKAKAKGSVRRSSMKILRAIRLYLLMGWLSQPSLIFFMLAFPMILAGGYMALVLTWRGASMVAAHLDQGLLQAISLGLKELFTTYTYSVVFCSALLIMGFQIMAFVLLFLQNKFYFEEIYLMGLRQAGQKDKARESCDEK